jgi:molybdate transport system substrate-binding protein
MRRISLTAGGILILLVAILLARPTGQRGLTVFAAASLSDAFSEIAAAFEAENPGVNVRLNLAGSSTLAAQLREGAPADIFASANPAQMQAVADAGRIRGTPQTFTRNALVIIAPVNNPADLTTPADLGRDGVRLVMASCGVPVRDYAEMVLERMAAQFGADFPQAVRGNLVSEESNVRQVAAKIALAEADAGIVYRSDVTPDIRDDVLVIDIPPAYNITAQYPIALTDNPTDPDLAAAFVAFVLGDSGQAILESWGFHD